jgi:hypothetical protein
MILIAALVFSVLSVPLLFKEDTTEDIKGAIRIIK